jgi:hypothetical protein
VLEDLGGFESLLEGSVTTAQDSSSTSRRSMSSLTRPPRAGRLRPQVTLITLT